MAHGEWQDTSCSGCGTTIHYHISWDRIPDLCKECIADRKAAKAKWHETSCQDCGTTIPYHEDWDRIPDLCKPCREARKAQWREKSCIDCGTTIRYKIDWDNVPDICKSCREKRRSQWHEKQCLRCPTIIRYHQTWERIPDYCKECNTWQYKTCAAEGCSEEIRYKLYWDNIPEYCKPCKTGQRPISETRDRPDGGWDEYTGWGYVNRNGVIVFVDDGPNGKHSHAVYRADGTLVGYREEGHGEEWNNELWKETTCRECGNVFHYHIDWGRVPERCTECNRKEPHLARHLEDGIHGERIAESVAVDGFNFDRTDYTPPYQGIDNIFRDGDNLVIVEAKSVTGYAPNALHNTQEGRQMSRDWIWKHAMSMRNSDIAQNRALGEEIIDRLNRDPDSIRRMIINTDPRNDRNIRCYESGMRSDSWSEVDPLEG